ncbi:hypothetical protein ILUMI_04846 [Ignelater luminosus]|uniref:Glycosyltransferase family 92 protein n=1 Tax=Ignelater luminosus TaxID=2038154 RepID=A0A8K0D870_IGNLU|nr:hypothetical protein ILUMI_04846 [Ignelater luminosus]
MKLNSNKKFSMTVCVKPLDFTKDISNHLIEWIEMNKILGANKFEFFVYKVPENVLRILQFYRYKYKGNFLYKYYQNIEEFFQRKLNGNELLEKKRISRRESAIIARQASEMNNENIVREESGIENVTLQFDARHNRSIKENKQSHNHVTVKLLDMGIRREASLTVNNTEVFERKIWQKRRNELMAYNDCLYRNLRSSHFVIPVDIDEIIVPKRFYTWEEVLGHLFASAPHLQEEYASFSAQNVYFLEETTTTRNNQDAVFFFKYTKRTEFSEEGESGKSFVSSKNALTVFNHYALDSLKPGIRKTYFLPRELVQMNHYKRTCSVNLLPQCAKYLSSPVRIVDTLISKYKKEFIENYEKVFREFYIFNKKRKWNHSVGR